VIAAETVCWKKMVGQNCRFARLLVMVEREREKNNEEYQWQQI